MRFPDVGRSSRTSRIVPWQVPEDFSVDRYADVLLWLTPDDLVFTQRRFVLGVDVPAGSEVTALDRDDIVGGEVVAGTFVTGRRRADGVPVVTADEDRVAGIPSYVARARSPGPVAAATTRRTTSAVTSGRSTSATRTASARVPVAARPARSDAPIPSAQSEPRRR